MALQSYGILLFSSTLCHVITFFKLKNRVKSSGRQKLRVAQKLIKKTSPPKGRLVDEEVFLSPPAKQAFRKRYPKHKRNAKVVFF